MFGTLAAAKARGDDVVLAIATDGAADGGGDPAKLRRIRQAEAGAAGWGSWRDNVFVERLWRSNPGGSCHRYSQLGAQVLISGSWYCLY